MINIYTTPSMLTKWINTHGIGLADQSYFFYISAALKCGMVLIASSIKQIPELMICFVAGITMAMAITL